MKPKPTDKELIDDPPQLPKFDKMTSGITANTDENSTPFDVFSLFFPELQMNKYTKAMFDKLRRTNGLKKTVFEVNG